MKKFTFAYPTKVYFGEGIAAEALEQELSKVGEAVMLAYGGGSIHKNGIYKEINDCLLKAGKKVVGFSGIMPNPTYMKVQELDLVCKHHVDFILAVGGGSAIDCCKVISAQTILEEDIWQMEYRENLSQKAEFLWVSLLQHLGQEPR